MGGFEIDTAGEEKGAGCGAERLSGERATTVVFQ